MQTWCLCYFTTTLSQRPCQKRCVGFQRAGEPLPGYQDGADRPTFYTPTGRTSEVVTCSRPQFGRMGRRRMDGSRPVMCSGGGLLHCGCSSDSCTRKLQEAAGSLSSWGASGWGVGSGVPAAPVPHDTEPQMFANQDHNIGWNLNKFTGGTSTFGPPQVDGSR